MSEFRFKRFTVRNERSAMKVNTDGVLLGAAMTLSPQDSRLLDIGTGTGTIALMAAQRLSDCGNSTFLIEGIDIDSPSAEEAAENFSRSVWSPHLSASRLSLSELDALLENSPERKYDMIFSNPPYYDNSLQAPECRRNEARHTVSGLSYRNLCDFASSHLSSCGRLSMIVPSDSEHDLMRYARMNGLFPFRIIRIRTVPTKRPSRVIAEFTAVRNNLKEEELVIRDGGKYTDAYVLLTSGFYLAH